MPLFRIRYDELITYETEIEADTADEALSFAKVMADDGDLYDFSEQDNSEPMNWRVVADEGYRDPRVLDQAIKERS